MKTAQQKKNNNIVHNIKSNNKLQQRAYDRRTQIEPSRSTAVRQNEQSNDNTIRKIIIKKWEAIERELLLH